MLSCCIKELMLLLVSSTQNASVKGFQILDGILFFLIDKPTKALIEKRELKRQPEAYREYTWDTKRQKTKRQTLTSPQLELNQSTKLIKERGPPFKQDLAQEKRLQTKEFFILRIDKTSLSKTIMFLSFQTVQNKQKGAARQVFPRFLSTKEADHPEKVSLTVNERTQWTPNKENTRSHKTLALGQWTRMWFIVSSLAQHKKHLFAKIQPLLLSWSWVRTFPQEASQAKKTHLCRRKRAPNDAPRKRDCTTRFKSIVKGLYRKNPILRCFPQPSILQSSN